MTTADDRLLAFRATRKLGIDPAWAPSDAPASEEYSYSFGGMDWFIRCEGGRYVYAWIHPANADADTLADAEARLLEWAIEETACDDEAVAL